MNSKQKEGTLDSVLFQFHREVTKPTPDIVAAWSRMYPEYAADIQAHAVEMLNLDSRADASVPDMESLEAEARSAGINAVFEANQRDAAAPVVCTSLREVAAHAGLSLRELADNIGIARSVVADVNSGAIMPETVSNKFFRVVSSLVKKDFGVLRGLIPKAHVGVMHEAIAFKAAAPPSAGKPRTWRDAINASDMPEDKKAYWLSDED
jgi:DNA-binding transcriptional regulator YiaG